MKSRKLRKRKLKKKRTHKILFCEPCAYKEIIKIEDIGEDFESVPDVPGGAPRLDPVTKKAVVQKATKRNKKKKCPKCGRGVFLKELPKAYDKAIQLEIEKEEKEHILSEKKKRIEDGKPLKRESDRQTDF